MRLVKSQFFLPLMLPKVARRLAESLHQPAGAASGLARGAVSAADAGAAPPPPHTWHSYYNELAMRLIRQISGTSELLKPSCPLHLVCSSLFQDLVADCKKPYAL